MSGATTAGSARQFIAGEWLDANELAPDIDPTTGEIIGRIARGTVSDVEAAVVAARAAQPGWAALAAGERGAILSRAASRLEQDIDTWARLVTVEMGKALSESIAECRRAVRCLRFYAGEADRELGALYASEQSHQWLFTRREPLGVIGVITPWNFPAAIPTWKSAPSLVFGNTVVIKLADDAPLAGLRLAEALEEAGIPPGVFNVVLGSGASLGPALVTDPGIDAVTFTGSTAVGHDIRRNANVPVQLEMGGHSPMIVRADADIARAVDAIVMGAYASSGQKCTATRRVYTHRSIHHELLSALVQRTKLLEIGNPLDAAVTIGPLVNERQLNEVLAAVDRASKLGTLVHGGRRLDGLPYANGFFMEPAILTDLPHDAEIACEETFGPALSVWPFDDDDEALALANRTRYGLSAAIFTRDLGAAKRFVEGIRSGTVRVNAQTPGAEVHAPFGGWGDSGFGPTEQGRAAVEFFTHQKTVYLNA